jgi:hypothetical protein
VLPNVFGEFFLDKIIKIRNEISYEEREKIFSDFRESNGFNGHVLSEFKPVTPEELKSIIAKSSHATCSLAPLPSWLLKACTTEFLDNLVQIVNLSLKEATVPESLKQALVIPLIKKANLDPDILKNYRPVSNLSYLSKLIERVVAVRLNSHFVLNKLLDKFQSAYRKYCSTESALLRVQSDIVQCLDNRSMVALALLDLSAAFDTLEHSLLLQRLEIRFGVVQDALKWIGSYLSQRTQKVLIGEVRSDPTLLAQGVPQGSVLGPLLFIIYVTPLADIAKHHGMKFHFYADDTQLYVAFDPNKGTDSLDNLEQCISSFKKWMCANFFKLNDDKTELILFGSKYNMKKFSSIDVQVGSNVITSTSSVKNLGAIFDSSMVMDKFVNLKVSSSIFYLRNIARIRRYLTPEATKLLVHAYVISRIDYSNSILYGVNKSLIRKLQLVHNAAARLIANCRKYDHITPILIELHWLPVEQRILFKNLVFVFNCIHGCAPEYSSDLIVPYCSERSLRSGQRNLLQENRTATRLGDRAFVNFAPKIWNSLPYSLKNCCNLYSFKRALKTYLFRQAFM